MKTKLFLTALALPLVFGACSNDELISTNTPVQNGELVEVGPNFVISANKGGNNSSTRAAWEKEDNFLNFLWKPVVGANGTTAILDRVGLCWVGNSISDNVYTNYEFVHAGWLAKDESAADVDPCSGLVKNGYNFYDMAFNSRKLDNVDGVTTDNNILDVVNYVDGVPYASITAATTGNKTGNYNLKSAFFKTSSQTMFGGNYIAYSPFNKDFKDQGHIQATSPVEFSANLATGQEFAHLGEAMFAYGYAPQLVGGTRASDFSFNNLSGLIRVRVTGSMSDVTAVALVDADNKFISKVGLDAQKIASGATGTQLYVANEKETTNMLTATVIGGGATGGDVYFSALPTTTGALKVVLYNGTTKKSAVYDVDPITVVEGNVAKIDLTIDAVNFNKNVAINQIALAAMIDDGTSPITLLGDIKLASTLIVSKAVTINGGRIIVPANDASMLELQVTANATINSAIFIENKGCCANNPGKLTVGVATGNVKATLGGVVDNYGEIEFVEGAGVTIKNVTTVTGVINNHAEYIIGQDDTLYGSILIEKLSTVELKANAQNDGIIIIVGTGANDTDGTLNVSLGVKVTNAYEMTNAGNINNNGVIANTAKGWFIDKIGSQFGYNQFDNSAKGQYVCEVNGQNRLNAALSTAYPTTRVRFVDNAATPTATTGQYDFKGVDKADIDFEIAMAASDDIVKFISTANPSANVTIKNLIITSGELQVMTGNIKTLIVKGGILVNGENAKDVTLETNISVDEDVNLVQMMGTTKMIIGGKKNTTSGVYAKTTMDVKGKFVVGDAASKSTKKAAVSFLNNNTTNITGAFILNKPGTCTIEVASSVAIDNNAAFVWASAVTENGGTWGNSSKVKIKAAN